MARNFIVMCQNAGFPVQFDTGCPLPQLLELGSKSSWPSTNDEFS